jgi:hypothetical protein
MEYKIINVDNYLLAISDNQKRGWFYCVRTKTFFHDEGVDVLCCNGDLSVVAHLPLNGSIIIDGLNLLPSLDKDLNGCEREYRNGYNKARQKYKYDDDFVLMVAHRVALKYFNEGKNYKDNVAIGGDPLYGVRRELKEMIKSFSDSLYPVAFYFEGEEIDEDFRVTWIGEYIYC